MGARLMRLLTGLLDAPDRPVGDIELVDPFERARLLQTWSASSPDHPMAIGTLVDRFDAVVAASPDRTAVRWDGRPWSYDEIARRVRALAHQLIAFGAGPETLVAVALLVTSRSTVPWVDTTVGVQLVFFIFLQAQQS